MKLIALVITSFLAGSFIVLIVYVGIPVVVSEDYKHLLSPLTILISSSIALSSALISVHNSNRHTRQKNTIDVIGQGKGSIGNEFRFINSFLKRNEGKEREALIFLAENSNDFSEMEVPHKKLNELEHLCEGMFKNFYDKNIIKNTRGSTIIWLWNKMGPYMLRRREMQQAKVKANSPFARNQEYAPYYWLEKAYNYLSHESVWNDKFFVAFSIVTAGLILIFFTSIGLILDSN